MLIVTLFLKMAMMIARPIATSAAATAITKKTKSCPITSPKKDEYATKVRFAEFNISSIDINTTMAFRLVSTPATPVTNIKALKIR